MNKDISDEPRVHRRGVYPWLYEEMMTEQGRQANEEEGTTQDLHRE
jgi:hypothetical protein